MKKEHHKDAHHAHKHHMKEANHHMKMAKKHMDAAADKKLISKMIKMHEGKMHHKKK